MFEGLASTCEPRAVGPTIYPWSIVLMTFLPAAMQPFTDTCQAAAGSQLCMLPSKSSNTNTQYRKRHTGLILYFHPPAAYDRKKQQVNLFQLFCLHLREEFCFFESECCRPHALAWQLAFPGLIFPTRMLLRQKSFFATLQLISICKLKRALMRPFLNKLTT